MNDDNDLNLHSNCQAGFVYSTLDCFLLSSEISYGLVRFTDIDNISSIFYPTIV